jgi:catechol 2,3-dioxygenase-like lactoylglutathione lyase family enzyme
MERSLEWYKTNLGFNTRATTYIQEAELKIAYITNGEFEIELFEKPHSTAVPSVDSDTSNPFSVQGYKHFSFVVDNVDVTWEDLKAKNLDLVLPPTTNDDLGVRYSFIRDPDGILLEFLSLV